MCPKHALGTCSGTGQCQDSPNYYWADLDRTNSDKAWKRARTRFYSLFGMTFSFEHELRNGECTALPGRRASVKGGLGARRIGQHHGKRHCHVSLECKGSMSGLVIHKTN